MHPVPAMRTNAAIAWCVTVSGGHARHPSDVSSVSLDSSVPDSGINFPDDLQKNNVSTYNFFLFERVSY